MGHNIYINEFNRASFFSARTLAWHGLGQIVKGALTSKEALKEASLDYEVGLAPVYAQVGLNLDRQSAIEKNCFIKYPDDDGNTIETQYKEGIVVPNTFATYREDTNVAFGIVGSRYTVVQNHEAFNFFDTIVGKGEAIYETAGALGNGETVFITAKLPDYISVPGEAVEKYIFLKLTHDGKGSITGGFTPVRIVCNNTLNFALKNMTNTIRIRHTTSAHDKLQEAYKLIGIANKLSNELGEIFTHLKKQTIVGKDVMTFFKELLYSQEECTIGKFESSQKNNIIKSMQKFYYRGVGQDSIIGTKFGVYNAVSGYYQNVKTSTNPQKMLESTVFGTNASVVEKSLNMLLV